MMWYYGIWVFISGLFIGSFLNVCIYRIPNKVSIVTPGSACPSCKTNLKPKDLVPVFSYLFLGRKCRYCAEKISPRYMGVEILTAVLFTICFIVFGLSWQTLAMIVLTGVLITITFIDLDHFIIPDPIVLFGLIVGIVFVATGVVPNTGDTMVDNILGALLGLACGAGPLIIINLLSLVIFKRPGIGGGDIKLMGMAGIYLGYQNIIVALALGILFGGIYGVIFITKRKKALKKDNKKDNKQMHEIPFGPHLAMGIFISMLWGSEILRWYISLYV